MLSIAIDHRSYATQPFQTTLSWLAVSIVIGAYIGWLFRITRRMRDDAEAFNTAAGISTDMLRRAEEHFLALLNNFFNQHPFDLFLEDSPHSGVLGTLLRDSIKSMNGRISEVNEITYLLYLKEAISHADEYFGVQREPVRWFRDTEEAADYLRQLKDREMRLKRRIFVIDRDLEGQMEADLKDKSLMDFYWTFSTDVKTYYIRTDELKKCFDFDSVPEDFAMYDGKLIIKYDAQRRVVSYDGPREKSMEKMIIECLETQLRAGRQIPFRPVAPPKQTEDVA